jgi:transposase
MKKHSIIVGVDVSKSKLDVSFLSVSNSKLLTHFVVENNKSGINKIVKDILTIGFKESDILFCFENTGVYSLPLSFYLCENNLDYWMVPAIEIKRSKGISRGKTDKSDSKDIAFYALTHMHKMQLSSLPESDLIKLKLLYSERMKLVKSLRVFDGTKDTIKFLPKEVVQELKKNNQATIKALKKQLKSIEEEIKKIILSNQTIKQQFDLIQTIPGVGPQTATYLIICTKCFTAFSNWRKLACYAGVAPFEYSSGSSVRARTKVHHLADKQLKSLLNMCALNIKRLDKDVKLYYERKTNEGKNPMLVMNAIRCKIISRVFAVVNRNTPYVDVKKYAA